MTDHDLTKKPEFDNYVHPHKVVETLTPDAPDESEPRMREYCDRCNTEFDIRQGAQWAHICIDGKRVTKPRGSCRQAAPADAPAPPADALPVAWRSKLAANPDRPPIFTDNKVWADKWALDRGDDGQALLVVTPLYEAAYDLANGAMPPRVRRIITEAATELERLARNDKLQMERAIKAERERDYAIRSKEALETVRQINANEIAAALERAEKAERERDELKRTLTEFENLGH